MKRVYFQAVAKKQMRFKNCKKSVFLLTITTSCSVLLNEQTRELLFEVMKA